MAFARPDPSPGRGLYVCALLKTKGRAHDLEYRVLFNRALEQMRLWPGGAGDDIFAAVRFGTGGDQRLLTIIQRLRIFFQRVGARQC